MSAKECYHECDCDYCQVLGAEDDCSQKAPVERAQCPGCLEWFCAHCQECHECHGQASALATDLAELLAKRTPRSGGARKPLTLARRRPVGNTLKRGK